VGRSESFQRASLTFIIPTSVADIHLSSFSLIPVSYDSIPADGCKTKVLKGLSVGKDLHLFGNQVICENMEESKTCIFSSEHHQENQLHLSRSQWRSLSSNNYVQTFWNIYTGIWEKALLYWWPQMVKYPIAVQSHRRYQRQSDYHWAKMRHP